MSKAIPLMPPQPLTALQQAIEVIQEATCNPNLHAHKVMCFLYVAANQGKPMPQKDLKSLMGSSIASVSRTLVEFGEGLTSKGKVGYGLLDTKEDPENRTSNLVTLTPKGQHVQRELERVLQCGAPQQANQDPKTPYRRATHTAPQKRPQTSLTREPGGVLLRIRMFMHKWFHVVFGGIAV